MSRELTLSSTLIHLQTYIVCILLEIFEGLTDALLCHVFLDMVFRLTRMMHVFWSLHGIEKIGEFLNNYCDTQASRELLCGKSSFQGNSYSAAEQY